MDYTPYKESECAFEYNLSVYDYIKDFKSIFCSNEMYMNHISWQNKSQVKK